jgi:hypothetical protein
MSRKRRKRRENRVAAHQLRFKEEALLKDTTGVEAWDVFKVAEKIDGPLSSLMIVAGALLSLLSMISILTSMEFLFSDRFFIGTLGLFGATNIFCGLILLAKK